MNRLSLIIGQTRLAPSKEVIVQGRRTLGVSIDRSESVFIASDVENRSNWFRSVRNWEKEKKVGREKKKRRNNGKKERDRN